MDFITQLERIKRINQLVKTKSTGNPAQLARRLELSERRIYQLISLIKTLGAPIYFDREYNSYCYSENIEFTFGFQ